MKTRNESQWSSNFSRRDFLRLGGVSLLAAVGITFPPNNFLRNLFPKWDNLFSIDAQNAFELRLTELLDPQQQGRVLNSYADTYDIPSFSGSKINKYWHDTVLSITGITIGKSNDSFNMVWYKLRDGEYVHSGDIQPVLTKINKVVSQIPKEGMPAEVTVPFTDAHWKPITDEPVAYRFYYATTYWVMETLYDPSGNPWYGVVDDKWGNEFFAPAQHLRIIPAEEIKPLSPNIPPEQKRIEVHIPEQVMIAYENIQPVYMARLSSGALFSNGDYSTPPGRYMTFHKRPSRHMARGNLAANGYDLPGVPWNSYITEEGIAFHGTYWHNNFGKPRSHGCINLTPQAAKWVYLWTMPTVPYDTEWLYEDFGTTVDIIGD